MQNKAALTRLKARKDWDGALIFIRGRQPIGLDTQTDVTVHDEESEHPVVTISSPDTPNPLYNPKTDGLVPPACTMTIYVDLADIVSIDFVQNDKIIQTPGSKLVSL